MSGYVRHLPGEDYGTVVKEEALGRTIPMTMRGTPADAPAVRRLFDAVAVNSPMDDFGYALFKWAEEVTRLLEAGTDRG